MGLLDDAIREHLELKRRHGADPDEVARQENEALGETRRAEFARPEGGAEPVAEAEAPVDAGDEREPFDVEAAEAPTTIAEPEGEPWLDERDEVPADEALDHPRGGAEIAPEPAEIAESERAEIEPEPAEIADIEPEPPDLPPETAAGPAEAPPETAAGPPETAAGPAEARPETVPGPPETAAEPPETGPGGTQRAPEPGEEDVLEETPEFLQETPEHDRLWFEQRPPRDFDWDK